MKDINTVNLIRDMITNLSDAGDLASVMSAVQVRRAEIGDQIAMTLQNGTRVRFSNTARPRYLQGVECTFVRFAGAKAMVKLDSQVGRYWGEIRTPLNIIEKI